MQTPPDTGTATLPGQVDPVRPAAAKDRRSNVGIVLMLLAASMLGVTVSVMLGFNRLNHRQALHKRVEGVLQHRSNTRH